MPSTTPVSNTSGEGRASTGPPQLAGDLWADTARQRPSHKETLSWLREWFDRVASAQELTTKISYTLKCDGAEEAETTTKPALPATEGACACLPVLAYWQVS